MKDMSCIMRKSTICICENKDADQLRSEADSAFFFRYMDSTIPLLYKSFHDMFTVEADDGLDRDVIIGIAVGSFVALVLIVIIIILFCLHLKRTR